MGVGNTLTSGLKTLPVENQKEMVTATRSTFSFGNLKGVTHTRGGRYKRKAGNHQKDLKESLQAIGTVKPRSFIIWEGRR